MESQETLSAVTAVIQNLCRPEGTSFNVSPYSKLPTSHESVFLPGPQTSTKQSLENELTALVQRVQSLENQATSLQPNLPDTPNEYPLSSPPLGSITNGFSSPQRKGPATRSVNRKNSHLVREARVSNILAAKTFSDEEMATIRDHLDKQAEEIKCQSETIDEISRQLQRQEHTIKDTFVKVENEDLSRLERELKKHAQANEAFQRALKEIGTVIASIAAGDLSKKVKVHAKEMDDEIVTFKRTINTMIDQLDAFGREVSRVAKEVGTEGILGGQAHLPHVNGIWRDVTYNGKSKQVFERAAPLTESSQYDGHKSHRAGTRDRRSHHCCCKGRSDKANHPTCSWRNCTAPVNDQHNGGTTR